MPLALAAVFIGSARSPSVRADEWDKKTVVTFDQDVEIPGQVLPAGTYVFKLMNSSSNRTIVQVWTYRESQLLATLITIGDSFPNHSGRPCTSSSICAAPTMDILRQSSAGSSLAATRAVLSFTRVTPPPES